VQNRFVARPSCGSRIKSGKAHWVVGVNPVAKHDPLQKRFSTRFYQRGKRYAGHFTRPRPKVPRRTWSDAQGIAGCHGSKTASPRPSCGSRIMSGKASWIGGGARLPAVAPSTFPDFAPTLTPPASWPSG